MHLKSSFYLILILCVASLSPVVGSSQDIKGDEIIIYALPFNFDEYTFHSGGSYSTAQWNSAVYASLIKRSASKETNWIGDIASGLPSISPDNKTYLFIIRDNLQFSNGHKLTTSDVELSFKVILTPKINNNTYTKYSGYLYNNSIKIIDDKRIEITFDNIHNDPYSLLNFPLIDEELFEDKYNRCIRGSDIDCIWNNQNGEDVISAGPYRLDDVDNVHEIVTVTANPFYYNATQVYTDKIIFWKISNEGAALANFTSGVVHILDNHYSSLEWKINPDLEGLNLDLLTQADQDWQSVRLSGFNKNKQVDSNDDSSVEFIVFMTLWLAIIIVIILSNRK